MRPLQNCAFFVVFLTVLAGCETAPTDETSSLAGQRFLGFTSVPGHTLSPGGCAASVLFSDFSIPKRKPRPGGIPSAYETDPVSLALIPLRRETSLNLYLRGAVTGTSAPAATLTLSVNDQQQTAVLLPPSADEASSEPFTHDFTFALAPGLEQAVIRAAIAFDTPVPADDPDSSVSVDSLDMAISDPGGPCFAPGPPPEKDQTP